MKQVCDIFNKVIDRLATASSRFALASALCFVVGSFFTSSLLDTVLLPCFVAHIQALRRFHSKRIQDTTDHRKTAHSEKFEQVDGGFCGHNKKGVLRPLFLLLFGVRSAFILFVRPWFVVAVRSLFVMSPVRRLLDCGDCVKMPEIV